MKIKMLAITFVLLFMQQAFAHETADSMPHVHLGQSINAIYTMMIAISSIALCLLVNVISKSLKRKEAHV